MRTVTVIAHQSLLDIAVQEYGAAEAAFALARANDLNVTDRLDAGMQLTLPTLDTEADILAYYQSRGVKPATADPLVQYKDLDDIVGGPGENWFNALPGLLPYLLS